MPSVKRAASNYLQFNKDHNIITGEFYDPIKDPSMTVPDGVMSLKDLIERHAKGQHVPIKDAQYQEDITDFNESYPDVSTMTKIELLDFNLNLKTFIINGRKSIERWNAEQAELKKAEEDALENGQPEAPTEPPAPEV